MKTSILITSYCRPEYLQWNLNTLLRQHIDPSRYEVVVLNDGVEDTTINVVSYYADEGLPIRYIFTGQRNRRGKQWRVPGFAWNVGIQECDSPIVILTCAEMYHLGNTFDAVVTPVLEDESALGTPRHVHDDDGGLIEFLNGAYLHNLNNPRLPHLLDYQIRQCRKLKPSPFRSHPDMPFWMAMRRQRLLDIGGFDEDFTGIASDDNDLLERLLAEGAHYVYAPAEIIHLNHGRRPPQEVLDDPRFKYNRQLMIERRGNNVRNQGRPWGKIEEALDLQHAKAHEELVRATSAAAAALYNVLPNDYSILDIGCGDKTLLHHITSKLGFGKVTTVDGWPATQPNVLLDLTTDPLPFPASSYDVVLLMDVVEHLEKDAALRIITEAKAIARHRVILYTPKDFDDNSKANHGLHEGNPHNLHRSAWTGEELQSLGFTLQDRFPHAYFAVYTKEQ